MFVAAGVSDVAIGVREKLRGKIGQTKVKRYWPGKKPDWVEDKSDDDEEEPKEIVQKEKREEETHKEEIPDHVVKDDPRLRRLAENRRNREEAVARHREIRQAEIISTAVEDKTQVEATASVVDVDGKKVELLVDQTDALRLDQEDEDAVDESRRRKREKMLQKLREEEMLARAAKEEEDEDEEEEEEEESEYETDSEEENVGIPMIKPVFVKKTERETIAERERLEAEELAIQEAQQRKLEERKKESVQMVYEVIKKEKEMEKNKSEQDQHTADVDTDDDTNPQDDYEAWKAREIARIKREREQAETSAKEKEELEKIRKMSEEERLEWEKNNPKPAPAPKGKQSFLQKYYHKGAFFQSDVNDSVLPGGTDIFKRDYSAPTGEDKLDKSILPKVMQVKDFGRSGRTKWTHLVNEDTTRWDSPWANNDKIRTQYMSKMAGMNKPIAKPQGTKKLKRSWEDVK